MYDSDERNQAGAYDNEGPRVAEIACYHQVGADRLEEMISEIMIQMDEWIIPRLEETEQAVRDMEDLHAVALTITPDMEDELNEARTRWADARVTAQVANDKLADMEQALSLSIDCWGCADVL